MKFTQKQAQAMYNRLKALETWLEDIVYEVASDCEEATKLSEIQDTLNQITNLPAR